MSKMVGLEQDIPFPLSRDRTNRSLLRSSRLQTQTYFTLTPRAYPESEHPHLIAIGRFQSGGSSLSAPNTSNRPHHQPPYRRCTYGFIFLIFMVTKSFNRRLYCGRPHFFRFLFFILDSFFVGAASAAIAPSPRFTPAPVPEHHLENHSSACEWLSPFVNAAATILAAIAAALAGALITYCLTKAKRKRSTRNPAGSPLTDGHVDRNSTPVPEDMNLRVLDVRSVITIRPARRHRL